MIYLRAKYFALNFILLAVFLYCLYASRDMTAAPWETYTAMFLAGYLWFVPGMWIATLVNERMKSWTASWLLSFAVIMVWYTLVLLSSLFALTVGSFEERPPLLFGFGIWVLVGGTAAAVISTIVTLGHRFLTKRRSPSTLSPR